MLEWNKNFDKKIGHYLPTTKIEIIYSFKLTVLQAIYFRKYINILQSYVSHIHYKRVLHFIWGFHSFQINYLCNLFSSIIVLKGTFSTIPRCTTFEIANFLKTKILPSLSTCLTKFQFYYVFSLILPDLKFSIIREANSWNFNWISF